MPPTKQSGTPTPRADAACPLDIFSVARELETELATQSATIERQNQLLDECVTTLQILVGKVQRGEARSKHTYAAHLEMLNKIFAHRSARP